MGLFSDSETLLNATASFPKANPTKEVVNGQTNKIFITLKNLQTNDLTLLGVTGSVHDPRLDWKLLRNTSDHRFKKPTPILASSSISFPYNFHSEFKPSELGLTVFVDGLDFSGKPFRQMAFNNTIHVVEPPSSFFDPGLIFLWIIFASIFALFGYPYLKSYLPTSLTSPTVSKRGSKKSKKSSSDTNIRTSSSSLPSEKVLVPAQAGKPYPASTQPYEEEWIPASLLKKGKKVASEAASALSIGDEKNSGSDSTGGVKARKPKK